MEYEIKVIVPNAEAQMAFCTKLLLQWIVRIRLISRRRIILNQQWWKQILHLIQQWILEQIR